MFLPTAERVWCRRLAAREKLPASTTCTNVAMPLRRSSAASVIDWFLFGYSECPRIRYWRLFGAIHWSSRISSPRRCCALAQHTSPLQKEPIMAKLLVLYHSFYGH